MLFKRKHKQSLWQKMRQMIWPTAGWKRSFIYIKHRILRLPHSSHDISMGLAAGCVVSFTPTWGIQILQCFIFCKLTRANFLASLLGTTFGNPWTFPILIWISYTVGDLFLSFAGLDTYISAIGADQAMPHEGGDDLNAFVPTLIGGYMVALITFPAFYYGFYILIKGARAAKSKAGATVHVVAEKVHDIKEHRKEKKQHK